MRLWYGEDSGPKSPQAREDQVVRMREKKADLRERAINRRRADAPVIDYWIPDAFRCIHGRIEGKRDIRTSRVLKRDGKVVTTKSGSRYELGTPHSSLTDVTLRRKRYGGAKSVYGAIDYCIKATEPDS